MIFCVLGPLEVHEPTGARIELGAAKPSALLVTLLLQANGWVSAERLLAAIWPEDDAPLSADRNLKTYVWRLRKMLPGRVQSRPGAYRITVAAGELDADVFTTLVGKADRQRCEGQDELAADTCAAALEIWRGTPYEEIRTDEAAATATRLTELRRHAQESLATALLASGRRAEAITLLRTLTTEDPLRERTWTALVLALHSDGRRAEALACYQQARATLIDELGVEPGSELARAQRDVLSGATADLDRPRADGVADTLPRDLPDFVGRTAELAALLAAAGHEQHSRRATPVVLIVGMGGVGKTALALHAAHQLGGRYPDGRLFVNLREQDRPLGVAEALRRLLVAIGTPPAAVPDQLFDRIARWRASVADRRMLLVLDDAEDAESVLPLLPGGSRCCVLVTSRGGLPGLDGTRVVGLDVPSDAEAGALFLAMAGESRASYEPSAVADVVRACGNLPLAVRIAATRLQYRPLWTIATLAARLRDPAGRDEEFNRGDRSVLAVFEPSYRRLSKPQRQLFAVLAAVPGQIDAATAAKLAHVERTEAARILELLAEEHLLIEAAPGRYRLHTLARDLARTGRSHESTVDGEGVPAVLRGVS